MNTTQRFVRRFFFPVLSGCLLGAMPSANAQEFKVSPAMPGAYQPFTITLSIYCQTTVNVDPYVDSGAITIEAKTNTIDLLCPSAPIDAPPATVAGWAASFR